MFSIIHIVSANANLFQFYFQMPCYVCSGFIAHSLNLTEYYNVPQLQPIRELEQLPDCLFFLQYDASRI